MSKRKKQWALDIPIFSCLVAALVLRFYHLDNTPGLNGDDAWLAMQLRYLYAGLDSTFMTPTHRIVSPSFTFLAGLVQLLPWTNMHLLRLPTALGSVATVLVIPLLFRSILSRTELVITTLIVACLPLSMAYARSLGEMSQVPLAMVFVLAFVYRGKILASLLALALSSTVHPTCMLALPIVIFGCASRAGWKKLFNRKVVLWSLALLALLVAWQFGTVSWRSRYVAPMFIQQMTNFEGMVVFLRGIVRIFTGSNVIEGFVGPVSVQYRVWSDWTAGTILFGVFSYGSFLFWQRGKRNQLWNLIGLVLGFATLYLLSSPGEPSLEAGYERYALFLIVPMALQIAKLISEMTLKRKHGEWIAISAVVVVCTAMMVSFKLNYIDGVKTPGTSLHMTYRTGPVEPKLAAFQWIQQDHAATRGAAEVIAEDWWLYWPLTYFNSEAEQFQMHWLNPRGFPLKSNKPPEVDVLVSRVLKGGGYLVGFKGENLDKVLSARKDLNLERYDALDYQGQIVLSVWRKGIAR